MQSYFKRLAWLFTALVIAAVSAVACSTGEPVSPDANAELAVQSAAGTGTPGSQSPDSEVFVSDKGFIKVGIGTSVDDVYPSGLDPSCFPPGPGYPPSAGPPEGPPPVPGYLPEGSVLHKEHQSPGGWHMANTYAGPSNNFRVTVMRGVCPGLSLPAQAFWELVTVAGRWGILFEGACFDGSDGGCDWDPNFARILWIETDEGFVELRSVINPLDKDELIKIAESVPEIGS